jgi:hypothetical protein
LKHHRNKEAAGKTKATPSSSKMRKLNIKANESPVKPSIQESLKALLEAANSIN